MDPVELQVTEGDEGFSLKPVEFEDRNCLAIAVPPDRPRKVAI